MSKLPVSRALATLPVRYFRTGLLIVLLVMVASLTFTPQAASMACGGPGSCQCPGC